MNILLPFSIIAIIVLLILVFVVSVYNSLVQSREMIYNAKGQIAAQIESRWDALTNLISAAKQYSDYEKEVIENTTRQRTKATRNSSVEELEQDDQQFEKVLGQINVVAENYPDLKASRVYQNTMTNVRDFEDNVRHSRMIYNDTVTKHNRRVQSFPINLLAGILGFSKEEYFAQTDTKNEMPNW